MPDLTFGDIAEIKSFLSRTCDDVLSWLPGTGRRPAWQSEAAREFSNNQVRADGSAVMSPSGLPTRQLPSCC
jgi:hypothetical protein